MQLSVTFRHMEPSDALKRHAREKLEKIRRFFPDPISAHVVLATERGFHHHADVNIQLHNGLTIKGTEITEDMYSSIDLVMAKIERQVRKYHDKIRGHKERTELSSIAVAYHVLDVVDTDDTDDTASSDNRETADGSPVQVDGGTDAKPASILTTEHIPARTLSVDEALLQLNLLSQPFLVFRNSVSSQVNVVYRRDDGKYGLIETGLPA